MEKRIATWVALLTSVLSLVIGGGWYQQYQQNQRAVQEENQRLIMNLETVATKLAINHSIYEELHSAPFAEPKWGILESYLIKIQRDGMPKHVLMKNRIDTLVEVNAEIIELLTTYRAFVITDELEENTTEFLKHAVLYNDRWESLPKVFEAKANFPTGVPTFPKGLPAAVEAEIAARKAGGT